MALAQTLICKKRELRSKGYLNELKRNQQVPGVIYGKNKPNQAIVLSAKELSRIFKHSGTRGIFSLQIEGEARPVMVLAREIQKDSLSQELTHVDFLEVSMSEKINSIVTVHITGEEDLSEPEGVLQVMSREIAIQCLPADIPETIVFDISAMHIGDKVRAADLSLPQNVELMEDPDTVMAIIVPAGKGAIEDQEPELEEEKPQEPES